MATDIEKAALDSGEALKRLSEYSLFRERSFFVAYAESLVKPRDPNAPPPTLAERIRSRLRGWAYRLENAPRNVRWWIADRLRQLADQLD